MRLVAVVVLVLGLGSIDAGLNLIGSPYSLSNLARSFGRPAQAQNVAPASAPTLTPGLAASPAAGEAQDTLTLNVVNSGYEPAVLQARANRPLQLKLVTNKTYSCARAFVIPTLNIQKILPETGAVLIDIPPQRAGSVLYFTCSMGMYSGRIKFS